MTLDLVIERMADSDAAFTGAIGALSPEQWLWKPAAETWSVAECAEHVVIVEQGVLFRLRTSSAEGIEKTSGKEQLLSGLHLRTQRLQAPARVMPTGRFASPGECLAALETARAATLAWASDASTQLESHVMPHPMFGELHGLQWLGLIASHQLRHVGQMREVMAMDGYPTHRVTNVPLTA
jgi:uncharacterized damage-inducible protein DinB